ncbi:MAG: type IX secretion system protein PorQ [Bacteroidia bacterium]
MNRLFTPFICALVCWVSNATAQSGGTGVMSVFDLPLHARSMAWGGYLLASPLSDVQFAINNPGLLNKELSGQYGATFGSIAPGVRQGGAAYAHTIGNHNLSLHAQYLDYGTMEGYDAGGNFQGDIMANEMKFTLGYAREVIPRLDVGSQLGFGYSVLGPYVSTAAFVNLGAHYSRSDTGIYWGLVVKNLGMQLISYRGADREPLPFNIQLGATYKPLHMPFRFHATLHTLQKWDITYNQYLGTGQLDLNGNPIQNEVASFGEKAMRHLSLGGELVLGKHLGVLIGYNHQRRMEMSPSIRGGLAGFGWGIRIKVWKYHLTYASASLFPGQNTNTLSLSLIPSFYN